MKKIVLNYDEISMQVSYPNGWHLCHIENPEMLEFLDEPSQSTKVRVAIDLKNAGFTAEEIALLNERKVL